ncbi:MAG: Mur ligase family protein [Gammaproteobacteria bacterium]|nr:Mur ligase family protein [Gammaproteobacteria bacterium]
MGERADLGGGETLRAPGAGDLAGWLERIGVEHPKTVVRGVGHVAEVAARAGLNPPAPVNFVVAGTNGKGSTAIFLERLLLASGRTVGTTLSPHLARFNERIRVDAAEVEDEEIVTAFETVEAARQDVALTYFEYAILAAFSVFRQRKVDASVLEVGLGGRLDAVNVVDADVAIITSIGLEHQDYLGPDVEAIGAEKAGVMRRGRPVVFGAREMPNSVRARAAELHAPLVANGVDYQHAVDGCGWDVKLFDGRRVRVGERPRVAADNAAAALQALAMIEPDFEPATLAEACRLATIPGRLERLDAHARRWVLDVAHNPHAARFLRENLEGRIAVAILGMLEDKDHAGVAMALAGRVDRWVVTDNAAPRGLSAEELGRRLPVRHARHPRTRDAIAYAVSTTEVNDGILVLGSFDTVARARQELIRAK